MFSRTKVTPKVTADDEALDTLEALLTAAVPPAPPVTTAVAHDTAPAAPPAPRSAPPRRAAAPSPARQRLQQLRLPADVQAPIHGWDWIAAVGSELTVYVLFWFLALANAVFTILGVVSLGGHWVLGVVVHAGITLIEQHLWRRELHPVSISIVVIATTFDVWTGVFGLTAMLDRFVPGVRVAFAAPASPFQWVSSGSWSYLVLVLVAAEIASILSEPGIKLSTGRLRRAWSSGSMHE